MDAFCVASLAPLVPSADHEGITATAAHCRAPTVRLRAPGRARPPRPPRCLDFPNHLVHTPTASVRNHRARMTRTRFSGARRPPLRAKWPSMWSCCASRCERGSTKAAFADAGGAFGRPSACNACVAQRSMPHAQPAASHTCETPPLVPDPCRCRARAYHPVP